MNSKIVLAAFSLALVFNGASVALAGGKKATVDPRQLTSNAKKSPGPFETWCDVDPKCNGWEQALQLANSGKLKY